MTLSSAFLGSFGFLGLMGLGDMVTSSVELSPKTYAEFKTKQHAKRKAEIDQAIGTGAEFSPQSIKPTELENANIELNNEYNEQSGDSIPHLSYSINLNPDPRIETRIAFEGIFNEWVEGYLLNDQRFKAFKADFDKIQQNYNEIGVQKAEKETIAIIKKALQGDKINLRFLNM
ncbi:MAG: hypothetical protein HWN79_11675, partial [Candidatus Lokiarchaeota archaeon]|nr:hypothetical protein [Candidatus Lokiarchaeota archaeon]